MSVRRLLVVWSALSVLAGLVAVPSVAVAAPDELGRYLVVLRAGADPGATAAEHGRRYEARVHHVYRYALIGYAATMSARAAERVAADARVLLVEGDQRVRAQAQTLPTGVDRISEPNAVAVTSPHLDIDGTDAVRVDVDVAVIDTGIDVDHPDLNIVGGVNCAQGGPNNSSCEPGNFDDGNGHGTHVAGTIAALDNGARVVGVAPGARLWAVRVLDNNGSGWISWIVAGVDWTTANASTVEVANMSLGCECSSSALDSAITNSVKAGVVYAVAAGNNDKDASTFSPANHAHVITVSALADFNGASGGGAASTCRSDQDDTLADFSNWGSAIDVAAPGVCILSTWRGGGTAMISGTSMASPHVAGAAALLASGTNDPTNKADVDAIRSTIVTEGNLNWVDDSGDGTKEPLLDVSDHLFAPATVGGGAGGTTTSSSPDSVKVVKGSALGDPVANLSADDGASFRVDSAPVNSKHVANWYGQGSVDPAGATTLTFTYDGSYSRTVTQLLFVRNFDTGKWERFSRTSVSTSDQTFSWSTSTPDPYVSGTGLVRLRVLGRTSQSFTANGDLMRFAVG